MGYLFVMGADTNVLKRTRYPEKTSTTTNFQLHNLNMTWKTFRGKILLWLINKCKDVTLESLYSCNISV